MTTPIDPVLLQVADDSALAAVFAAAVAAGDSWEWQRILDDVTDLGRAKQLLSAMCGQYVNFACHVCEASGQDVVDFLTRVESEKAATADQIRGAS